MPVQPLQRVMDPLLKRIGKGGDHGPEEIHVVQHLGQKFWRRKLVSGGSCHPSFCRASPANAAVRGAGEVDGYARNGLGLGSSPD